MDKKNKEISLQAKMLRKCIQMATSEHLIGPKIKDGTLRKKVKEPQWHCPEGYSFFADTGKEVLCGNSDTAKNTEQYGRFTNAWRRLYWQNEKCIS